MTDHEFIEAITKEVKDNQGLKIEDHSAVPLFRKANGRINREHTLSLPCFYDISKERREELLKEDVTIRTKQEVISDIVDEIELMAVEPTTPHKEKLKQLFLELEYTWKIGS